MQIRDKLWQDTDNSRLGSNNNVEFAIIFAMNVNKPFHYANMKGSTV